MARPGIQPSLNREHIITQAFDMIQEQGLERFSVRSLSRRLNISPMALYTYFPSKADIINGVTARLREKYDTDEIPGESWDNTLRRTAHSIRRVNLAYPEVFQAVHTLHSGDRTYMTRIHRIYEEQGMPQDVCRLLWCCIEAYLVGFIHGEIFQQSSENKEVRSPNKETQSSDKNGQWPQQTTTCYNDETFSQGIEFIVDGIKARWPEASYWVTPTTS